MPSLCPVCGRAMCDHTPEERGQTYEEMMRPLSAEEERIWREEHDGSRKIAFVREHAHDPVK